MKQKTKFKQTEVGMIPEDWEITLLHDICNKITDGSHFSPPSTKEGELIATVKNMNNFGFVYKTCRKISKEDYDKLVKNDCRPLKNDILIAKDGSFLKHVFVSKKDESLVILSSIAILRPNIKKIMPSFLKYIFLEKHTKERVSRNYVTGAVIPRIILEDFRKIPITVTSLQEQKAIAKILSDLDSKIELNQQMNQILEEIAQTIFTSWFVNYEFPDENGKPYRFSGGKMVWNEELGKEIPEGWDVKRLNNYANLNPESWTRFTMPNEINYIDLTNTKRGVIGSTKNYLSKEAPSRAKRVLQVGDTIVGTTRPKNMSYALIGEPGLTGSTGFAVLRPQRTEYRELVYLSTTAFDNMMCLAHMADGAAYPAISSEIIMNTLLTVPILNKNPIMLLKFSQVTSTLLDKMLLNNRENRILSSCRDSLLPKLMSGKIRVPIESK